MEIKSFQLNTQSGMPFYRQIVDQIRFGIATDKLSIGEQLPTVRSLAVHLQINLNTVGKAYKELEIQKILYTQQGTGTFVAASSIDLPDQERDAKLAEITIEFLNTAAAYGFGVSDLINQLKHTQESHDDKTQP
ncbi:MAG TPA: GntR family transcriptional regulator [Pseudomonadales bacterium]|jgi:GntR family transcriptional regulator|nr:GntR family transcriptional regulator [Pseudomonadales bacterium]MDP7316049.1 GntR family transcriptional regulator [Pseudomonadales bacterium]HJP52267.1 GntR family transcriptional regulator [Pseudomonadales bacterium]